MPIITTVWRSAPSILLMSSSIVELFNCFMLTGNRDWLSRDAYDGFTARNHKVFDNLIRQWKGTAKSILRYLLIGSFTCRVIAFVHESSASIIIPRHGIHARITITPTTIPTSTISTSTCKLLESEENTIFCRQAQFINYFSKLGWITHHRIRSLRSLISGQSIWQLLLQTMKFRRAGEGSEGG